MFLFIGILIGFGLSIISNVFADLTDRNMEYILNRVWNTTNNSLYIKGV